tara:strand:- start:99 stop:671 length:573 start_codon:yes stop_codon:yes gene_type:complete
MFLKKNYFLYIDNTQSININLFKNNNTFNIIYRNHNKKEKLDKIVKFQKLCKRKGVKLYIANDIKLGLKIGCQGIYLSSFNKKLNFLYRNKWKKIEIIGSAHNFIEINNKLKQGCNKIVLSRLFKTKYENKKSFLGVTKFNLMTRYYKNYFIALGGIRESNIKKIKMLKCKGVALLSEVKKKPAILRRLF